MRRQGCRLTYLIRLRRKNAGGLIKSATAGFPVDQRRKSWTPRRRTTRTSIRNSFRKCLGCSGFCRLEKGNSKPGTVERNSENSHLLGAQRDICCTGGGGSLNILGFELDPITFVFQVLLSNVYYSNGSKRFLKYR